MTTTIANWFLVDLVNEIDHKYPRYLRSILWGDIVEDETGRFSSGDFVCTNFIATRDANTFITRSGNTYICLGQERHVVVNIFDLPLLRHGISPIELENIKYSISLNYH
jgi:hypothetical protein